jgi:ketopantoate reductase PanE/ApbA-like protein
MLQDIRRGRRTEIEFINGYVVNMARQFQLDAPIDAAIVETVHAITSGRLAPNPGLLAQVLQARTHKWATSPSPEVVYSLASARDNHGNDAKTKVAADSVGLPGSLYRTIHDLHGHGTRSRSPYR